MRKVKALEAKYRSHSSEIVELSRRVGAKDASDAVVQRIIQNKNGHYRIHVIRRYGRQLTEHSDLLVAWDGDTYTVARPKIYVTHHTGVAPPQPVSQPFGLILEAIGYFGKLGELIESEATTLRVSKDVPSRIVLTRITTTEKPLRANHLQIELETENGLRILSAERAIKSQNKIRSSIKLSLLEWHHTANGIDYALVLKEALDGRLLSTRTLTVYSELSHGSADSGIFRLAEHSGNPWVREFHAGNLQKQGPYHDRNKPTVARSTFQIWLGLNLFLMTAGVAAYLTRVVRSKKISNLSKQE